MDTRIEEYELKNLDINKLLAMVIKSAYQNDEYYILHVYDGKKYYGDEDDYIAIKKNNKKLYLCYYIDIAFYLDSMEEISPEEFRRRLRA